MSRSDGMTYGGYLTLGPLLSAQHPISDHHDELLFIILHQTKELWLKQIIHELDVALGLVRDDRLIEVHKNLSRVSRIQAVMTLSWDVLTTLDPDRLHAVPRRARRVERLPVGPVPPVRIPARAQGPGASALPGRRLARARGARSGARPAQPVGRGERRARPGRLPGPGEALERDWRQPYRPDPAVEDAWAEVYRDTERWWRFYQLAEKLVDIDDAMAAWRHKHVITVERVIGLKRGTGGTAGVPYLQSTVGKRAFPELWTLRTQL